MADRLDATDPSDAELDGSAAEHIRDLKTDLNLAEAALFEDPSVDFKGLQGWPRIYTPANAAALAVIAATKEGQLAIQEDTRRAHWATGAAWNAVVSGPLCYELPFPVGMPRPIGSPAAWADFNPGYWSSALVGPDADPFGAGAGCDFNVDEHPATATVKLYCIYMGDAPLNASIRVWDVAAGALVAGSTVALGSGAHEMATAISVDLRANMLLLGAGPRKLRLQLTTVAGNVAIISACLRITVA